MNELLPYLLKSTLCLSLLYLAFRTVMRKEVFFTLNRMVLITIVVISFIIPLLYLPSSIKPIIQEQPLETIVMDEITTSSTSSFTVQQEEPSSYSASQIIFFIYIVGMLFSFLVFMHGIVSVLLMPGKIQPVRKNGYWLFILEKDIPAFSFWKIVFISRVDYSKNGGTILAHEQQHIRLGHFYDLMLMEMVKMVYWFNPVIYWLIQDLKAIHEFQADRNTLSKDIDAKKYQLLIIEKGVGSQRFSLANSFNHCQIKKRITMMNQSKTSKAGIWKVATFLPLLALLLMAFGRTGENVQKDNPIQKEMLKQEKAIVLGSATQSKDSIYSTPEVMPQFPGGEEALRKFIQENALYSETDLKAYKQEKMKIHVEKGSVAFIINSKGKVISMSLVKSITPGLDSAVLRAIRLIPDWIPAKDKGKPVSSSYILPMNNFIVFRKY